MDDVGLVKTVFDLTCLGFLDRTGNVGGNGACLGRRHKSLGAEHLTETADHTHHIGAGDNDVEVEPVFFCDLVDVLLIADVIGTGVESSLDLVALCENKGADGLTGTVGKYHGAADLLVGMTGVNAQTDVDLDGLIEFCLGGLAEYAHRLGGVVLTAPVVKLYAV